ncbi:chaplin [Streptomyces sp. 8L]|uniref:chaplin n=1 Tax=Streptomyces sp. 8L TaxID=2877242 RepID=UPI001CD683BF|nr:chaplin [Streptomyces sp. 8L]MCA1217575.1 chaplin [Streptomyces sp. 8L]
MRQGTRKGLITFAAAGGVIALGGGVAHADAGAGGSAVGSPGVLSGNNVQVPVHVPVNVCGNTVNVVGLLNPAMGNQCANASHGGGAHQGGGAPHGGGSSREGGSHHGSGTPPHTGGGGAHQGGGSHAGGGASHSPGVGSGNDVSVPIDVPVNICGLGVNVLGIGNPVTGESCENADTPPTPPAPPAPHHPAPPVTPPAHRDVPPAPQTPKPQTVAEVPVAEHAQLAHTGADGLGIAIPAAAGMVLAGTILYRRSRAAA